MKCSFCGDDINKGEEKIFVTIKGNALYFCSRKCEKNQLKLHRKARNVEWTSIYRKEKEIRKRALGEGKEKVKEAERPKPKKAESDGKKK